MSALDRPRPPPRRESQPRQVCVGSSNPRRVSLPRSKGQLVDPCVIGISCAISIHLKMDAKTVGAWLGGGTKRLIDGILHTVQSQREEDSFSVTNFGVDREVIPAVERRPLTRNARR